MDTFAILNCLKADSLDTKRDTGLGHGYMVRAIVQGLPVVAVGGERAADTRVQAFVDGLHWFHRRFAAKGKLRFVLGSTDDIQRNNSPPLEATLPMRRSRRLRGKLTSPVHSVSDHAAVLDAIAVLHQQASKHQSLQVEVDLNPDAQLLLPDYPADFRRLIGWNRALMRCAEEKPPPAMQALSEAVGENLLCWFHDPAGGPWVGRMLGLRVCTTKGPDAPILFHLGSDDNWARNLQARQRFRQIIGEAKVSLAPQDVEQASNIFQKLADERQNPDSPLASMAPANRLEAQILNGSRTIHVDSGPLQPVQGATSFHLPTLWSPEAPHHNLDLLLRQGNVPWAVEVDVPFGGLAKTVRRAMRDAVLHRFFIQNAEALFPFFEHIGLNPASCVAAVAIPAPDLRQPSIRSLFRELLGVARDLDVKLMVLPPDMLA